MKRTARATRAIAGALVAATLAWSSAALADEPIAVLFVGNSYTFGRVDPVMSYNAANVADLMSWTNILAPIDQYASGAYAGGYASVWVGSSAPNVASPGLAYDCDDWSATGTTGTYMLAAGSLWDGYAWSSVGACSTLERVYCLQQ